MRNKSPRPDGAPHPINYAEAKQMTNEELLHALVFNGEYVVRVQRVVKDRMQGRSLAEFIGSTYGIVREAQHSPKPSLSEAELRESLRSRFETRASSSYTPEGEWEQDQISQRWYHPTNPLHSSHVLVLYEQLREGHWPGFARMLKQGTLPGTAQAELDRQSAIAWVGDALRAGLSYNEMSIPAQRFFCKLRRVYEDMQYVAEFDRTA